MSDDAVTSVDLLEEIRAALDELEPLLLERSVDIEMSRLRVLAEPMRLRQVLAELIGSAVVHSQPQESITVRVMRSGKSARIEIVNEGDAEAGGELPDLSSAAEVLRAMGGEMGTARPELFYWVTLPLAPGAASAVDA